MQNEVTLEEFRRITGTRNMDELKLVDPNAKVMHGLTWGSILQFCVWSGWVEGVEYLLQSNADLSARDNCGSNS